MSIDFPNSPAVNDTFTSGSLTWKYTGTTWDMVGATGFTLVNRAYSASALTNWTAARDWYYIAIGTV